MNTFSRLAVVLLLALTATPTRGIAIAQPPQGAPPMPPARKVPGITAPDTHPGACVDCHIVYKDMNLDTRFATLLKTWSAAVPPGLLAQAKSAAPAGLVLKGRHPAVPASGLKNIPNSCRMCHGETSKTAPHFNRLMHVVHLTGGEKNPFLTMFQGECTLCHKLDAKTGTWAIPSGPEK